MMAFDREMFLAINGLTGIPWVDFGMRAISGHAIWIAISVLAILIGVLKRDWSLLLMLVGMSAAIGLVDYIAYTFMKPWFQRPRPCISLEGAVLLAEYCSPDFGFPSNHAANGMAAVASLFLARKTRVAIGLLLAVFAVGFSRVYLGVHYPGDVLAGFLFGGVLGGTVFYVFRYCVRSLNLRI